MLGQAEHKYKSALEAVKALRGPPPGSPEGTDPISDQWLPPFVVVDDAGKPVGTVEDGDAVVLFNFRADRMVQLSKVIVVGF